MADPTAQTAVDHVVARYPLSLRQRAKMAVKSAVGLEGVRPVRIMAGPARGVSMTLDFYGHTPMYFGVYEMELHRFTRRALADAQLVFDVGAYIGYDALMFAARSAARVITFEPDAEHLLRLRDNVERNHNLSPRVEIQPYAVTAARGAGRTTLDEVARRAGAPDFIKIDIDGGEVDALEGGRELLRTRRPHVIVETHSLELEQQCGTILTELGYRPVIKHNRSVWREFRGNAPHNRWLLASGRAGGARPYCPCGGELSDPGHVEGECKTRVVRLCTSHD
jgi:precorrin-6B methylase 2